MVSDNLINQGHDPDKNRAHNNFIKFVLTILILGGGGYGIYYFLKTNPEVIDKVQGAAEEAGEPGEISKRLEEFSGFIQAREMSPLKRYFKKRAVYYKYGSTKKYRISSLISKIEKELTSDFKMLDHVKWEQLADDKYRGSKIWYFTTKRSGEVRNRIITMQMTWVKDKETDLWVISEIKELTELKTRRG